MKPNLNKEAKSQYMLNIGFFKTPVCTQNWYFNAYVTDAAHKSAYKPQKVQPSEEVFLKHADPASHT